MSIMRPPGPIWIYNKEDFTCTMHQKGHGHWKPSPSWAIIDIRTSDITMHHKTTLWDINNISNVIMLDDKWIKWTIDGVKWVMPRECLNSPPLSPPQGSLLARPLHCISNALHRWTLQKTYDSCCYISTKYVMSFGCDNVIGRHLFAKTQYMYLAAMNENGLQYIYMYVRYIMCLKI